MSVRSVAWIAHRIVAVSLVVYGVVFTLGGYSVLRSGTLYDALFSRYRFEVPLGSWADPQPVPRLVARDIHVFLRYRHSAVGADEVPDLTKPRQEGQRPPLVHDRYGCQVRPEVIDAETGRLSTLDEASLPLWIFHGDSFEESLGSFHAKTGGRYRINLNVSGDRRRLMKLQPSVVLSIAGAQKEYQLTRMGGIALVAGVGLSLCEILWRKVPRSARKASRDSSRAPA